MELLNQVNSNQFERLVFDILSNSKGLYRPLEVKSIRSPLKGSVQIDAEIVMIWQGKEYRFLSQFKSRTAPKIVREAFWKIETFNKTARNEFLLVVPFLSKSIVAMLAEEGVSGIDLSGNYYIQRSDFVAIRLDQKNQFPESQPIRKIYSENSSQVGLLLISNNSPYSSVNEIWEAIRIGGGSLSLSTVSKVLKGLEDDLIIDRSNNRITLIQPEKLLDQLKDSYSNPKPITSMKLKLPAEGRELLNFISSELNGMTWMVSGESSILKYAATTESNVLKIYSDLGDHLGSYKDNRFYNTIIESIDAPYVFFNKREEDSIFWSSQLQTYLELSKLDKREKEIAETIRANILKEFK